MWAVFPIARLANLPSAGRDHDRDSVPKTPLELALAFVRRLIVRMDFIVLCTYVIGLLLYTLKYTLLEEIPKLDARNKDFHCEDIAQHDCVNLLWIRYTPCWTLSLILATGMCSEIGDALKKKSVMMIVLWLILHLTIGFGIVALLLVSLTLTHTPELYISVFLFFAVLWRIFTIYHVVKLLRQIRAEGKVTVVLGEIEFVDNQPGIEMKAMASQKPADDGDGGEAIV